MCSTPISPTAPTPLNFSPRAQCPVYEVPSEIARPVAEKKKKDETAVADIDQPRHAGGAGQDGDRRRHAPGLRRSAARRPRREAAGTARSSADPGHCTRAPSRRHVNPPSNVVIADRCRARAAGRRTPACGDAACLPAALQQLRRACAGAARGAAGSQAAAAAKPTQTASASLPGDEATNFFSNLFTTEETSQAAPPLRPRRRAGRQADAVSAAPATAAATQPASAAAPSRNPRPTAVAEAKPRPLPEPEEAAAPEGSQCRRDPAAVAGVGV